MKITEQLATNFELGRIAVKKSVGEQLTPQEQYRSSLMAGTILTGWRYEFGEHQSGNLALKDLDVPIKRRVFGDPGLSLPEILATPPITEFTKFVEEHTATPSRRTPAA